ncbi:MAG: baseplate J/gp47 family protein [Polyangiaceae bacterium]
MHLGINAVATIHAAAIASSDSLNLDRTRQAELPFAEGQRAGELALTVGAAPWLGSRPGIAAALTTSTSSSTESAVPCPSAMDGVGAVPPADQPIEARYALGAGTEGNVARDTLDHAPVNAQNEASSPASTISRRSWRSGHRRPAFGGADAERLVAAQGRAVAHLERPVRATTLLDIERLALETPGVPVARARAIAERMAALPCLAAAGAVTLVVVPRCFEGLPLPTPALCRAVRRHLRPRLPVATELFVVGPQLTKVSVKARLVLEPNAPSIGVGESARQALATFLDPLRGGPDGDGWPVERGVHRTEIYELLNLGCPASPGSKGWRSRRSPTPLPRYGDCTCCSGACECGCRSADSWLCEDLVVCEDSILVSGYASHRKRRR